MLRMQYSIVFFIFRMFSISKTAFMKYPSVEKLIEIFIFFWGGGKEVMKLLFMLVMSNNFKYVGDKKGTVNHYKTTLNMRV